MMSNDVLDAWYGALRSGSPAALRAIVAPDIVLFWNGDSARIPWAGSYYGTDGISNFFTRLKEHLDVMSVTEVSRSATADLAVITLDGVWRIKRNSALVEARACNVFRFSNNRVAAYEVYNDTGRFDAALNGRSE